MASFQGQIKAGIESDWRCTMIDERKRKRKQSNRESARRSRMRKQKELEDLTSEVSRLQIANSRIVESINGKEQARIQIESVNNILRFEAMELMHRLRALNLVLQIVDDSNVLAVDVPNPLFEIEPWQLNLPMQPSAAHPDAFLV